jgi:hypothetical protein
MTVEQHIRVLRFNTIEARRIAARLLRGLEETDVTPNAEGFDYDGWHNGYYYAIKVMGENGRLRYPEGHAQAGQLIPGHFIIIAWQGPLSETPVALRDNVVTAAQVATVFPNGWPEVMG